MPHLHIFCGKLMSVKCVTLFVKLKQVYLFKTLSQCLNTIWGGDVDKDMQKLDRINIGTIWYENLWNEKTFCSLKTKFGFYKISTWIFTLSDILMRKFLQTIKKLLLFTILYVTLLYCRFFYYSNKADTCLPLDSNFPKALSFYVHLTLPL